jgi:hypothetical protein
MNRQLVLLLSLAIVFFSSCSEIIEEFESAVGEETAKAGMSGAPGEIILVLEDRHWKAPLGDTIQHHLQQFIPGFTTPEPLFDIVRVNFDQFSRRFKTHRNILLVEVDAAAKGPNMQLIKNEWALGQVVLKVVAPRTDDLIAFFDNNASKVVSTLKGTEKERLMDRFEKRKDLEIEKTLKQDHQLSMNVPQKFSIHENKPGFASIMCQFIRHDKAGKGHEVRQGVLVYYYPFTDDSTFTRDFLLARKDSINKLYVKGSKPNSYMQTEYHPYVKPFAKNTSLNNEFAMELKGWWKMENEFMGGPFSSITTIDKERNRIVTVEGFAYAPAFDKRELMRELEAITHSITFGN